MLKKMKLPTLHSPLVVIGAMVSLIAADQLLKGPIQSVALILCLSTIVIGIFLNIRQRQGFNQSIIPPENITKFDFVLARYRSTVKPPRPNTAAVPANIVSLKREKSAQIEG